MLKCLRERQRTLDGKVTDPCFVSLGFYINCHWPLFCFTWFLHPTVTDSCFITWFPQNLSLTAVSLHVVSARPVTDSFLLHWVTAKPVTNSFLLHLVLTKPVTNSFPITLGFHIIHDITAVYLIKCVQKWHIKISPHRLLYAKFERFILNSLSRS